MNRPYLPRESAVLEPYAFRQVKCWDAILSRLPGRSLRSAKIRLNLMRRHARTVGTIRRGGPYESMSL
jgi:hypothetical protein